MPSPIPKPAALRQRRNRPVTHAILPSVEEAAARAVPPLPRLAAPAAPIPPTDAAPASTAKDKRGSSTERGYTRQHQAWRRKVLAAYPRCVDCGVPSTEADHIVPFDRGGGKYDVANGTGRCKACHASKTARDQRRYAVLEAPTEWHPMVQAWWRDIWTSPMAHEYLESDKHGLYRLAKLHQQFWFAPDAEAALKASAEIRQQEVRFGLSPIDRRRLQWEIEKGEQAVDRTTTRKQRKQASGQDPRDVLKIAQ